MHRERPKVPLKFNVEIEILVPAPPGSGLSSVALKQDCKIDASGVLHDDVTKSLRSISGSLNGRSGVPGTVGSDGRHWEIRDLPGGFNDRTNTLTVTGVYTDNTPATPAVRDFLGTGGLNCSGSGVVAQRTPGAPIYEVLPRFYQVAVDAKSLSPQAGEHDLILGGLLQRTQVYLAFDAVAATPDRPVWHDINLPDTVGHWTLSVERCCTGLTAKLVLTRMSDRYVLPPLVWQCQDWQFKQPNAMHADHASGAALSRTVWVEPA